MFTNVPLEYLKVTASKFHESGFMFRFHFTLKSMSDYGVSLGIDGHVFLRWLRLQHNRVLRNHFLHKILSGAMILLYLPHQYDTTIHGFVICSCDLKVNMKLARTKLTSLHTLDGQTLSRSGL